MPTLLTDYQQDYAENTDWFAVLPAELQSTATRTSGTFINKNKTGLLLTVTVANEAGACQFTPKICTLNAFGGVITLWTAAASISANGTAIYSITPYAFTNSSFTEVATLVLPRSWYVVLTYAGTPANDKMDTKVSACLV
jgi:hypothetical protein